MSRRQNPYAKAGVVAFWMLHNPLVSACVRLLCSNVHHVEYYPKLTLRAASRGSGWARKFGRVRIFNIKGRTMVWPRMVCAHGQKALVALTTRFNITARTIHP